MGAVIFYIGPPAAWYRTQLEGLIPISGAQCVQTVITPQPLLEIGRQAHSLLPGRVHMGAGTVRAPRRQQSGNSTYLLFFFPCKTVPLVGDSSAFFFSSFSTGASGSCIWQSNVMSAGFSEVFEPCSFYFPVPKFTYAVSPMRQ